MLIKEKELTAGRSYIRLNSSINFIFGTVMERRSDVDPKIFFKILIRTRESITEVMDAKCELTLAILCNSKDQGGKLEMLIQYAKRGFMEKSTK
jgi:hypothetical protein